MTRRRAIATFDGVSIGVTTSDASLLGWLTEFLSPAVTWARGGSRRLRIDVVDDTTRWRRWFERGAADRDVSCFYLDTKIIHHPYWNAPVDTPVVYDDEFRVFYRWRRTDTIEILRQRRHPLGRLAVMRTLRDLFVAHTMGAGRLLLHGACVLAGDTAVAIAGPKRAGKSSLLVHTLTLPDVAYVANDRVLLRTHGRTADALGVPTIVSLRRSSLTLFPRLRRSLRRTGFHTVLTRRQAARLRLGHAHPWGDKYALSPAHLTAWLDVPAEPGGRLGAILFPRQTRRRGGIRLERLSPSRAAPRLRANLFRAPFQDKFGGLLVDTDRPRHPTRTMIEARVARIAAVVPCYECIMGTDAYRPRNGNYLDALRSPRHSNRS